MNLIPLLLAPLSLGVAFFVETSSWWVRVEAQNENVGLFISRSNIYLYTGRFFSLLFTASIAFLIEAGTNSSEIAILLFLTFLVSFFIQILIVYGPFRRAVLRIIVILLRLPKISHKKHPSAFEHFQENPKEKYKLFWFTLIASCIFGLGISLPLFLAAVFIENRLLLSNLAQAINAFGMIITLLFVDQKLYAAFDNSTLYPNLVIYTLARSLAFFIVSITFIFLWFLI